MHNDLPSITEAIKLLQILLLMLRRSCSMPSESTESISGHDVNAELVDIREAIKALKEEVANGYQEAKEILKNLSHVQKRQKKLQASIATFCDDEIGDQRKLNSCMMMLEEERNKVHAEARVSSYVAKVQGSLQRFYMVLAGELGQTWSELLQLFLEEVKEVKPTTVSIQELLQGEELSPQVWTDCQAISNLLVRSWEVCICQQTDDIIKMVNEEACPLQVEGQKESLLCALNYVKSKGY